MFVPILSVLSKRRQDFLRKIQIVTQRIDPLSIILSFDAPPSDSRPGRHDAHIDHQIARDFFQGTA